MQYEKCNTQKPKENARQRVNCPQKAERCVI